MMDESQLPSSTTLHIDTAVVGAGIAGLAAALTVKYGPQSTASVILNHHTLHAFSHCLSQPPDDSRLSTQPSILIFEARERPGGRIWSVDTGITVTELQSPPIYASSLFDDVYSTPINHDWDIQRLQERNIIANNDNVLSLNVDTGATWLHGSHGHPLVSAIHRLKLATAKSSEGLDKPQNCAIFRSDGTQINPMFVNQIQSQFFQILKTIEASIIDNSDDSSHMTVGAAINEKCTMLVNSCTSSVERRDISVVFESLKHYLSDYVGTSIDNCSLNEWMADEDLEGDQLAVWNMGSVIRHLVKCFSSELLFSHQVIAVHRFASGFKLFIRKRRVPLGHCSLSSPSSPQHTTNLLDATMNVPYVDVVCYCNHVIISVPIGVLKHNMIAFIPKLPSPIQSSISRIGVGLMNKVILFFKCAFWEFIDVRPSQRHLLFTYGPNNKNSASKTSPEFIYYTDNDTTQSLRQYMILNLFLLFGIPALTFTFHGEDAWMMERMTDDEIIDRCCRVLSLIFPVMDDKGQRSKTKDYSTTLLDMPASSITRHPFKFIITRWGADPFSRCSYSVMTTKSTKNDYLTLAGIGENEIYDEKQGPPILFAGEHCCADWLGTVHGAIQSGMQAGVQCIHHHRQREMKLVDTDNK